MTRLEALAAAARTYLTSPPPDVQRLVWQDISADLFTSAGTLAVFVRGTDPDKFANLRRDADVELEPLAADPRIGCCFAGPLEAAYALLALVTAAVPIGRIIVGGHSLGGGIAEALAGLLADLGYRIELWGLDPIKAGGGDLAAVLAGHDNHVIRFSGSIVSDWPFRQGQHPCASVEIGEHTIWPLEAHSITRAWKWEADRLARLAA